MSRDHTYTSVVLQTHDVGDADRFCILLTKERGKLAARAKGVRKIGSRMGGSLLPFQHIRATVHEGKSGFLITAVEHIHSCASGCDPQQLLSLQQVAEVLNALMEDEHPDEQLFADVLLWLRLAAANKAQAPTMIFRLFHLLGVLPDTTDDRYFLQSSKQEQKYIDDCSRDDWLSAIRPAGNSPFLSVLCQKVVEEQGGRRLKTQGILL